MDWKTFWRTLSLWMFFGSVPIIFFALFAPSNQAPISQPVETKAQSSAEQQLSTEKERWLCKKAAVCTKYGDARFQCATAANFKSCVQIKMGSDADYIGVCSDFVEGAPAIPTSSDTPNSVRCFFLSLGSSH